MPARAAGSGFASMMAACREQRGSLKRAFAALRNVEPEKLLYALCQEGEEKGFAQVGHKTCRKCSLTNRRRRQKRGSRLYSTPRAPPPPPPPVFTAPPPAPPPPADVGLSLQPCRFPGLVDLRQTDADSPSRAGGLWRPHLRLGRWPDNSEGPGRGSATLNTKAMARSSFVEPRRFGGENPVLSLSLKPIPVPPGASEAADLVSRANQNLLSDGGES